MPENPAQYTVDGHLGQQLQRPECVLAHQSGLLCAPCWAGNGGVSLITPTGNSHHILASSSSLAAARGSVPERLRPNGIALEDNGSFLLAHLGDQAGGIFRLFADGSVEPVVSTVAGEPLPPCNFIVKDRQQRLWITVSTRICPRSDDYRRSANTGFIAVCEPGESDARIVADGLGYTNECVVDEQRGLVFVNETFARQLRCYTLNHNAELCHPRVLTKFGAGTYPDGLALDANDELWVTSIVSNRIIRVSASGAQQLLMEDVDPDHLAHTETAFQADKLGRPHLDTVRSKTLCNISNLAFGGPSLKSVFLGNLLGNSIPWFAVDVCGAPMPHWNVELGPLATFA